MKKNRASIGQEDSWLFFLPQWWTSINETSLLPAGFKQIASLRRRANNEELCDYHLATARIKPTGKSTPIIAVSLLLVMLLAIPMFRMMASNSQGESSPVLTGTWAGETEGLRIRVVFTAAGTFTRTMTGPEGTETSRGQYRVDGSLLLVQPEGEELLRFTIRSFGDGKMVVQGEDGSLLELTRQAGEAAPPAAPARPSGGTTPPPARSKPAGAGPGPAGNAPARPAAPPSNTIPGLIAPPKPIGQPAPAPRPSAGPASPVPAIRPAPAPAPAVRPAAGPAPSVAVPAGAGPSPALMPEWVRPGLRLTYYLMTGSLSGSVNGWVPDEEGDWEDKQGNRYSTERKGHGSHGLIQPTVAGLDGQVAALAQPFYLFSGDDLTPVFNVSLDSLVTLDSGGDFWMHPRKQASMLQQHPWLRNPGPGQIVARSTTWTQNGQSWQATMIAILGDASRTLYVFDQESGRLLYLSRLTREAPAIRDRSQTLPDSVSHATFLRFVAVRQLDLPWLRAPLPDCLQRVQSIGYQGQFSVQFPGAAHTPLGIQDEMRVTRRGADYVLFEGRSQSQTVSLPSDFKAVTGVGCLPPLAIAPDILNRLQPGQEIDRDPQTGFSIRVAGADSQGVMLQADGPRQTFIYVYERTQGKLIRRVSRERFPSTPDMMNVRDLQLVNWQ